MSITTSKTLCVLVVLSLWWKSASAFADDQIEEQVTNSVGMEFRKS